MPTLSGGKGCSKVRIQKLLKKSLIQITRKAFEEYFLFIYRCFYSIEGLLPKLKLNWLINNTPKLSESYIIGRRFVNWKHVHWLTARNAMIDWILPLYNTF